MQIGLKHINDCFVCGNNNLHGLKVDFVISAGQAKGEFTPQRNHQGPRDMLHGGLICALLDEAMATLINAVFGTAAPTVSLEVRFRKPARLNEKLLIKAKLLDHDQRMKCAQASIETADGSIIATAKGKFLRNFKLA